MKLLVGTYSFMESTYTMETYVLIVTLRLLKIDVVVPVGNALCDTVAFGFP